MNQEQVLGLVRHILTAVGAILVFKGLADEGTVSEVIGVLLTSAGSIWSLFDKRTSSLVAKAESLLAKKK